MGPITKAPTSSKGYLDDLRIYDEPLSAAAVQTLYEDSAPRFRFEFDEEANADVFVDNSVNAYVGTPSTYESCTELSFNTLTLNSSEATVNNLYLNVDNDLLLYDAIADYTVAIAANSNITTIICDATTISAGVVYTDGTTAVLDTINTNATTAGTHSYTFSSGSNSLSLNYTIGSDIAYQPNPIPGTDGQIGNTALFDGNGYIEVADSTLPPQPLQGRFPP